MKIKHFTISQYSCISAAFLMTGNLTANIIYTDIDPDIVLDHDFEMNGVDMDNNGTYDFAFLNVSYTYEDIAYYLIQKIWAGAYGTSANEIAGTSNNNLYFPYALNYNEIINEELSFQNWGYQRMMWRIFNSLETWEGDIIYGMGAGGYWYPQVLDHYLGVHFVDTAGIYYYGWIRCDIKDEFIITGEEHRYSLIIKDYAYETMPDMPIAAGMKGETENQAIINNPDINIYNFDKNLAIILPDNNQKYMLSIFNISGSKIYSSAISGKYNKISCENFPEGNYIIRIQNSNGLFTQQLFIR